MKTLVIGDIHGRDTWKEIVKQEHGKYDKVIFIGDYFDSHGTKTAVEQIHNFRSIVEFKKTSDKPVILLIGNHDFHYLPCAGSDRYSGYNHHYWEMIQVELLKNINELEMCHQENEFLFSHAGVTEVWVKNNGIDRANLCHSINKAFRERPEIFKFFQDDRSNCGEHPAQSPIWVRPESLKAYKTSHVQVVGHTQQYHIQLGEVILIDAIEEGEYLEIEGNTARIKKVEKSGSIA